MNASVRPIPLTERKPTRADADAADDVLWLESLGVAGWVAWSGAFYDPRGTINRDRCSGVPTHWVPLSIFSTEAA